MLDESKLPSHLKRGVRSDLSARTNTEQMDSANRLRSA
jgi:hypothetical protein